MSLNNAAKSVAVRHFCSNVNNDESAMQLFDALANSSGPITQVLDSFGVARWRMYDDWDDAMWWEQLEILACDIDETIKKFNHEPK